MADPETGVTGDASLVSATATLQMEKDQYYFGGEAITPAQVVYSDNWIYEPMVLTYANNDAIGNATVFGTVNGYSVSKVFTIKDRPFVAQTVNGTNTVSYKYLQEAVDAVPANGYLKLLVSSDEPITVTKDLYLDLAGNDLTGKVSVNEGAVLYGMDSTTDDYDCSDGYGTITDLEGDCASQHKSSATGRVMRYLTYTEEDGKTLSFHRIYLGITKMSLQPGVVGVGYKAKFGGDEKVIEMLDEAEAFGYGLWLEGLEEYKVTVYGQKEDFVSGKDVTLRLENFDVENFGEVPVYAEVYLKLAGGEQIASSTYHYTLQYLLEQVEKDISSYSTAQIKAVQQLCKNYETFMTDAGWDVDSILAWSAQEA